MLRQNKILVNLFISNILGYINNYQVGAIP